MQTDEHNYSRISVWGSLWMHWFRGKNRGRLKTRSKSKKKKKIDTHVYICHLSHVLPTHMCRTSKKRSDGSDMWHDCWASSFNTRSHALQLSILVPAKIKHCFLSLSSKSYQVSREQAVCSIYKVSVTVRWFMTQKCYICSGVGVTLHIWLVQVSAYCMLHSQGLSPKLPSFCS